MAEALPPGSSIGILGGGQLGRMLALAAARLGLRCHVFAPDPDSPASEVAAATVGAYDDAAALERFAASVDVVTYEFENVDAAAAERLAELKPVRPGPQALVVAQDRIAEKDFLVSLGLAVSPYSGIADIGDLAAAVAGGGDFVLKTRRLGYDGKGQVRVQPGADLAHAFEAIGRAPAILERRVPFRREVSVIAVRGPGGAVRCYDAAENEHRNGILHTSTVPARIAPATAAAAADAASRILAALDYVGVLGVEFFVVGEGADERLLVNEIAPRVHNSGHWTEDACGVSQFENHIRAVAGWPLGSVDRHSDAVMTNLIGAEAESWASVAAEEGARLYLYGKREARPGRKMGHVTRLTPFPHPTAV